MGGMVDGVERERLYEGCRLRLRVAARGGIGSGRGGHGGSVLAKAARFSPLIPNPYFTYHSDGAQPKVPPRVLF
jgi:hypothetical protein